MNALPKQIVQGSRCRMEATHPMHASAGRGRRGTKINPSKRSSIRVTAKDRPANQLCQVIGAAGNRAANQVGIMTFKISGSHGLPA